MEEDGWGVWRIGEGEWIDQLRRERERIDSCHKTMYKRYSQWR